MSTNFYWKIEVPQKVILPTGEEFPIDVDDMDPRIHIGKRRGRKGGVAFSWAQDPGRVRTVCAQRGNEEIVVDEYGAVFTGGDFLKILSDMIEEDANSVGQWFS